MGISQIISKISCFILSWLKISFLLVITYLVSSQFVFICNLVSILSSTFCLNATVWHQTLLWMCLLERRFYRTRVRSLFTLVTNSLTHSLTDWLTHSCLGGSGRECCWVGCWREGFQEISSWQESWLMMCMIWSWSHQPYLFLCGNIESGGRDTSWIKVFLLLMEDLNASASLIKTVHTVA